MTAWWCEHAWLDEAPVAAVRVVAGEDGRISAVERGVPAALGDERLHGLVLPGFANAHSHAFHRALRGRTHDGGGTFWTWRERMYAVAQRLTPDSYLGLARAAYAEMALAGVTCVGEFHYLHDTPEMGEALVQAAADAGVRLTLLDACYLAGGLTAHGHVPLEGVQQRFGDVDVHAWVRRVEALRPAPGVRHGVAVHSVRAVPAAALADVRHVADHGGRDWPGAAPLHVHLSEQPAENAACRSFYGRTPTELLEEHGLLGARTTVVHATHLTPRDVERLGGSGTTACFCPTTERDLADGIGPARALADAGSPISLGSDQHAVVDLLEEARGLEMHERLHTLQRGRFTPAELVQALTIDGHDALGWTGAGRIAEGHLADLVAVDLDSPRTAGGLVAQAVYAATASDVHTVINAGRKIVHQGRHQLGSVGRLLREAIDPLWEDV